MEVLLLFLIVFLGTSILFRMPVGFSIGLGGVVTFLVYGFSNTAMAQSAFYGTNNFSLLAIPFFLFAGAVMEYSGISRSIFSFVDSFVGRFRASTGTVAIFACAAFGALTGSTQATIASISKIVYPAQHDRHCVCYCIQYQHCGCVDVHTAAWSDHCNPIRGCELLPQAQGRA